MFFFLISQAQHFYENILKYSQQDLDDGVEKRKYENAGQIPRVDENIRWDSKEGFTLD